MQGKRLRKKISSTEVKVTIGLNSVDGKGRKEKVGEKGKGVHLSMAVWSLAILFLLIFSSYESKTDI